MRVLANDIHDPHRNNDHLADGFAAERLFYRIEAQNGSLNFRILSAASHRNLTPFLAGRASVRAGVALGGLLRKNIAWSLSNGTYDRLTAITYGDMAALSADYPIA